MIKYLKGDVVKALQNGEVNCLMHCCNAQGVMGSGIALQIKQTFPDAYASYADHCNNTDPTKLLGSVDYNNNSDVINIIGQKFYNYAGRQVHYGAVAKAFNEIQKVLKLHPLFKEEKLVIGIPYLMCCDRAGGNWIVIEELLSIFPDSITINVYKLN